MKYLFRKFFDTCDIISVVGLAKNSGKTTTLNRLIEETQHYCFPLGLVSTGRDGERYDVFTSKDKPRITVPAGTFFATTEQSLTYCQAKAKVCENTAYTTSMGKVLLAQTQSCGTVEIAGPTTVEETIAVLNRLRDHYKTKLVLIDGSINRIAITTSRIKSGIIIATGAALGSLAVVVRETKWLVKLFQLPAINERQRMVLDRAAGDVMLMSGGAVETCFDMPLLDNISYIWNRVAASTEYVYTRGVITDHVLMQCIEKKKPVGLIAEDASKVHISALVYNKWIEQKGAILVKNPLTLLAITCNPYNPFGESIDALQLLRHMRQELSVAVHDVVSE